LDVEDAQEGIDALEQWKPCGEAQNHRSRSAAGHGFGSLYWLGR
jgi:hypothetical protein